MKVEEVMTKDPACCTAETKIQDVAKLMIDRDCGEIPVVDGPTTKKPVGVITDRDLAIRAVAAGKSPLTTTAGDVMTRDVATVTPSTSVDECCEVMERKQVRRIPVVDDKGACCGIVSQADLATRLPEKEVGHVVRAIS